MKRALSALTLVAAAAAMTLVASPAHAADPPVVLYASGTDSPGIIQVDVMADAGVATLAAHVVDVSTTPETEVTVVRNFSLSTGTDTNGYWVSANPVTLPHLGNYRLDVEVTDKDGVHVSDSGIGWLGSYVKMSFAGVKVTGTVTYANRQVTVSGQLLGTWPDGTVRPIEGRAVEVTTYHGGLFDTTSGRNGRFKVSVTIQDVDEFIDVSTLYDQNQPFYLQAYYEAGHVPVIQAPTKLTLQIDHKKILAGQSMTLSGQATWKSPTGWQPSANKYVVFWLCQTDGTNCNYLVGSTTTDADGRYSLTVSPYETGVIQAGTHNDDPFITTNTIVKKPITVLQLASFTDFAAARQAPDQVLVSGHLDFPGPFTPGSIPVEIQFSRTGTGGWRTQQTIDIGNNPTTSTGISFEQAVSSTRAGYWRVFYAGTPDFFESATSDPVPVG